MSSLGVNLADPDMFLLPGNALVDRDICLPRSVPSCAVQRQKMALAKSSPIAFAFQVAAHVMRSDVRPCAVSFVCVHQKCTCWLICYFPNLQSFVGSKIFSLLGLIAETTGQQLRCRTLQVVHDRPPQATQCETCCKFHISGQEDYAQSKL